MYHRHPTPTTLGLPMPVPIRMPMIHERASSACASSSSSGPSQQPQQQPFSPMPLPHFGVMPPMMPMPMPMPIMGNVSMPVMPRVPITSTPDHLSSISPPPPMSPSPIPCDSPAFTTPSHSPVMGMPFVSHAAAAAVPVLGASGCAGALAPPMSSASPMPFTAFPTTMCPPTRTLPPSIPDYAQELAFVPTPSGSITAQLGVPIVQTTTTTQVRSTHANGRVYVTNAEVTSRDVQIVWIPAVYDAATHSYQSAIPLSELCQTVLTVDSWQERTPILDGDDEMVGGAVGAVADGDVAAGGADAEQQQAHLAGAEQQQAHPAAVSEEARTPCSAA